MHCAISSNPLDRYDGYLNKEGESKMQKASKILTLSFGSLLLVSLVVPISLGQPTGSMRTFAYQEKAANPITISGTVSAVSESSVTVVDSSKVEHIITIDANTTVTKAGKAATVADIKANDSVAVVANKGEGTALTAVSIKIG